MNKKNHLLLIISTQYFSLLCVMSNKIHSLLFHLFHFDWSMIIICFISSLLYIFHEWFSFEANKMGEKKNCNLWSLEESDGEIHITNLTREWISSFIMSYSFKFKGFSLSLSLSLYASVYISLLPPLAVALMAIPDKNPTASALPVPSSRRILIVGVTGVIFQRNWSDRVEKLVWWWWLLVEEENNRGRWR